MKNLILLLFFAVLLAGCVQSPIDDAAKTITKESLMGPIEKLSSDAFEGRGTGTKGEQKSVNYLVNKLKEYGIEGGAKDGSYTQNVPLLGQKTDGDATISISKNGKTIHNFDYFSDFMAWPANLEENVSIDQADLVYVGYGIQAPEEDWDDFKDTDVEGKVIVVKNNDPSSKPDLFDGKTRLYYGRYDYKYEKAREMGAAGVLIVHTTPSAGYGWDVVSNSWNSESFYLRNNEEMRNAPTKVDGWLTKSASEKLFKSAGLDLSKQLKAAESRSFKPVPLKGLSLSMDLSAQYREMNTNNVLGTIEGSNERLKDEYMIFSAHYDHLGVTTPVKGDSINNGAVDNASGVSGMLNMARAYKKLQPQLKRSVLFLFVGAEEQGLLGSKYWASHPTVHPGKVTADINIDALNVYGKTKDMVLIGYGRNTVSDVIENLADEEGRTIKPDPHPDRGYFYRSDHFSFAKKGIPAGFPNGGSDYINKPEGYAGEVDSVDRANYHSVNDEINEYWDLSGMVQDTRFLFNAGYRIINAERMQQWAEGNEFKQTRLKMLDEAPE